MKKTTIMFEIHDVTTREMLCDNVNFDDIPELLKAYEYFYPNHQIEVCYRKYIATERVRHIPRAEFKNDWYNMIDDIVENLY